jgi:hypothetical protein
MIIHYVRCAYGSLVHCCVLTTTIDRGASTGDHPPGQTLIGVPGARHSDALQPNAIRNQL